MLMGVKLDIAQLQALALSVGFPAASVPTAAAVAMAESGGNPQAVGDLNITPGGSEGLWQINLKAHPSYDAARLFDPAYNAQAALAISSGGTNWNPWSTFKSGAYQKYLGPFAPGALPASPAKTSALLVAGLLVGGAAATAWLIHNPRVVRRFVRRFA